MAWLFLGNSPNVESTATAHTLNSIYTGSPQAGDLLIACISSRIASTASVTLPAGWTLVGEQKNNNTLSTGSAAPSGLMAYAIRGASTPSTTFTHPVAPTVAIGWISGYRNVNTSSPLDAQTAFTTATGILAVSGPGLTTTQAEDLIVAITCGGQEGTWTGFNATSPSGASTGTGATDPSATLWQRRLQAATATGADTSLAIFDAVKLTAGPTGNLIATTTIAAANVVIAGAFKAPASGITGTGTPAGQAGAVDGAGVSGSVGSGTPAAQAAAVSGSGTAGSAEATGTGVLAAGAFAVSGAGVSASVAIGALTAQTATAAGAGVSASTGSGVLAAQAATASGAGAVASTGTGALAAQAATVAGSGASVAAGSGALQADAAAVVGAGASASIGTGSLVAGSAEVAGTGTAAAANSGALVAQAATIAGLGVSAATGSGALQAGAATVAGAGLVASSGTGTLVASPATVVGEGAVLEAGAVVGTGALVGGAATLSGEGEVTGEVAPPVSVGGGRYYPYLQYRPPPVEGVGYAILPGIEGEAHGVVFVAGAGVALPRISGVGTGAAGVDGRSAARFRSIKAAAVGDRGQVGAAVAVLRTATASGCGVAVARGSGSSVFELTGAATGQHDDDEAAILALLAA